MCFSLLTCTRALSHCPIDSAMHMPSPCHGNPRKQYQVNLFPVPPAILQQGHGASTRFVTSVPPQYLTLDSPPVRRCNSSKKSWADSNPRASEDRGIGPALPRLSRIDVQVVWKSNDQVIFKYAVMRMQQAHCYIIKLTTLLVSLF